MKKIIVLLLLLCSMGVQSSLAITEDDIKDYWIESI